ncbi:MAG: nuclease-related domain-containing protein, partial [Actinomycetota bacterium]
MSTGTTVPVQPLLDPRGSRPGASAQAAYRRRRHKEREQWRDGSRWRWVVVAATTLGVGFLVVPVIGAWVGVRVAAVAGLVAWWRLRFHPSADARFWRRQAQLQRRTAGVLAQLDQEGWLVLHDIALPGWSASLDHLVIGPTGAW